MKDSKLIDKLTSELVEVSPISPLKMTALWLMVSLVCILVMLMMMPVREITNLISQPMAIVSGLWFLLNSVLLAFTTTVVGLPGRKNQRLVMMISFATYLLLIGALLGAAFAFKSPVNLSGTECIVGVIALSAMPLIFFYGIVRKLAPTSPQLMGLLLGLSASALGAFGLAFSCTNDDPLHLLIFHLITPALIIGTLGAWIGKRIFKW